MGLRRCTTREPLTWWRYGDGTVRVVCSQRHASTLRHIVLADGALVAPAGNMASCHCGSCNEDLPLKLDGWDATGGVP